MLRAEIERKCERLALVRKQMSAIEGQQREQLKLTQQPVVPQLSQLRAIGTCGAWVLT